MAVKIKTLRQTHPSYDKERWEDLTALAKGGKTFHSKIQKFLPKNAVEPEQLYSQRRSQAHYHSYVGSIINLYVAWLFAASFEVKPHDEAGNPIEADPFYGVFQEDVGDETTFADFTRERFRECLTEGQSYWLAELPSNEGVEPQDALEHAKRGLGRARIKALNSRAVLNWECNDEGQLNWAVVHSCDLTQESWAHERNLIVETWRIYEPTQVTIFEIKYQKNKKPRDTDEIEPISVSPHGFKRVPVIKLSLPTEICVGEQTHDPQLEHFRLDNALSWLIRRSCYAQPVFKLEDGEKIPTMGAGYAIVLGHEDDFGWTSPPNTPFDVLQKNVEGKRDEIFRVTHTMAQSVDNNAETVGRSADSKEIDAAATRIMLQAYATYVSKAIEATYETISEARDEAHEWSVEGFSGYDTATVASLIAAVSAARSLGIPSPSLHKALSKKVAMAMLAGEDQRMKEKIATEIEKATFTVQAVSVQDDLAMAQAEALRAGAEAEGVKADASQTSADASMIVAKKPVPKPAPRPAGK